MIDPSVQPTHRSVAEQLDEARADVRQHPGDLGARNRLWQWLAIQGDWKRAWEQVGVTQQLLGDAPSSLAAHRAAIEAEIERQAIFEGERALTLAPDSPAWLVGLAQALQCDARGEAHEAQALRDRAREDARGCSGYVEDERETRSAFAWLCDGDDRLGPVCELIVQGRYMWLPLESIASWRQSRPAGLTDLLWSPVVLALRDGSSCAGLMPARYPFATDEQIDRDDALYLGRRTSWLDRGDDHYIGVGQRMLLSDTAEHAMLDVRLIQFDAFDGSDD
ncbi:MAG: type VI secretion system accessory protein TagJ [Burkholderiaceae bacterium]